MASFILMPYTCALYGIYICIYVFRSFVNEKRFERKKANMKQLRNEGEIECVWMNGWENENDRGNPNKLAKTQRNGQFQEMLEQFFVLSKFTITQMQD